MAATPKDRNIYAFENFLLDADKRLLFDVNGEAQPLMPKAFDILLYLVRHKDEVVGKEELLSSFWPDTAVEENNLTQNISAIRRVLGEKHRENRFIATIPGRGYKFVADVELPIGPGPEPASPETLPASVPVTGKNGPTEPDSLSRAGRLNPRSRAISIAIISFLGILAAGILLWTVRPQAAETEITSMAILPFKSLGAETRDESLELGMTDTLIWKLSGTQQVSVRPLAAVRKFAASDQDSIAAGRALSVQAVLDGNIQISGDRIRVTAALYRVADAKQLWGGRFDEKLTDIFSVQDSISAKVASALKIPLTKVGRASSTESVEAYQAYMKGTLHTQRLVMPEVQKGIKYFEQAIEFDPNYARAYIGLEQAYRAMVLTNDAPPNEVMPKAKAAIQKALEIDPTLAEAWTALAVSDFWYDWDAQSAEAHHRKALELDGNSAMSHFYYAHLLSNTGRHEEAIAEIKRAREIDPVLPVINALEGQILTFAGRDDQALAVLNETTESNPDFWLARLFLGRLYLKKGMYSEALESATKARELTRGNCEATATVGHALAKLGRVDQARIVLAELESRAKTGFVPAYTLAQINLPLGNREKAIELLEKAFRERNALMVFLKVDPEWDELRSDSRFIEISRAMNL